MGPMEPMGFFDWHKFYFTNVCDVTWFLEIAFWCIAICIFSWPKKWNWKEGLIMLARFAGLYFTFFGLGSFLFPWDKLLPFNSYGLFYSYGLILIAVIYLVFFYQEDWLKKVIKISILAAVMCISNEMGHNLGLICGELFDDNFVIVVLARSLPNLLVIPFSILMYVFDIGKFKHLPKPLIAIVLTIALTLLVAVGIENTVGASMNTTQVYAVFLYFYIVMVIIMGFAYFSVFYVVESRHRITEAEIQITLTDAEREAVKLDARNREDLAKMRHDIKNQLSYVGILINEGKTEEAKKYIDELSAFNSDALNSFSCSNGVVSSIVNLELSKAKVANVPLKATAVVPPNLPIDDVSLCSLITNVIDNAIENYGGKDNKPVTVSIVTYQDYFRLTVKNPIDEGSQKAALSLKTRKAGFNHGYGTKIIKNIAKEYDGHASFDFENDVFVCDVVLTLLNKKEEAKNA